jgi:DNA polymerase-3 subunit alpha
MLDREGVIGGMITQVDHKIAKSGKGWAIFTLDDYEGSYEFKIFSEEYLRFRHLLVLNSLLYLKVTGRKNQYNEDIKISFTSMQLLQEVLEKYAKKITLQLPVEQINDSYLTKLESLIKHYKGSKIVHFKVVSSKEKLTITMPSKSAKLTIDTALINYLEKEQIVFKLN